MNVENGPVASHQVLGRMKDPVWSFTRAMAGTKAWTACSKSHGGYCALRHQQGSTETQTIALKTGNANA